MKGKSPIFLAQNKHSKLFLSKITDNLLNAPSAFLISKSFLLVSILNNKYSISPYLLNFTYLFFATFGHFLVNYVITFNNNIYISTLSPFDFINCCIL